MVAREGLAKQPTAIDRWSEGLEELHRRVAHRFSRSEARDRARRYLLGPLGRAERKNGWRLAEAIGEADMRDARFSLLVHSGADIVSQVKRQNYVGA